MANANAPFGFRPIRGAYSQYHNDSTTHYAAVASDVTPIRLGDPVTITGNATAAGTPIVSRSTAGTGNSITGIAVGFRPLGATEWLGYRPASTDYEVMVEDDPFMEFEIQDNGTLDVNQVGANAAIAFTGGITGNRSGAVIDAATVGTTVGLQLRLLGLSRRVDNSPGQFQVWRVRINNSTQTPNASSTGI